MPNDCDISSDANSEHVSCFIVVIFINYYKKFCQLFPLWYICNNDLCMSVRKFSLFLVVGFSIAFAILNKSSDIITLVFLFFSTEIFGFGFMTWIDSFFPTHFFFYVTCLNDVPKMSFSGGYCKTFVFVFNHIVNFVSFSV